MPLLYFFRFVNSSATTSYCLPAISKEIAVSTIFHLQLCFANLKYIVLQRKVHNVAIQFFPFNYSFFDNAFFKRKLSPVKVNMCA